MHPQCVRIGQGLLRAKCKVSKGRHRDTLYDSPKDQATKNARGILRMERDIEKENLREELRKKTRDLKCENQKQIHEIKI